MAYTRLLRIYYRREKPIPLDAGETCRLVRASTAAQRKAVKIVLEEFFAFCEDGWHNKRADDEIAAYQSQASTNRRIAQSRSGKRNEYGSNNDSSDDSFHGSSTKGTPNQEPRTKNQEPVKPLGGKPPADNMEFEEAWKRYPKRSGNNPKADALKAWTAREREGVTAAVMAAGVDRYRVWCEATAKIGTETVMQAVRFFGKSRPFEQAFDLPRSGARPAPLPADFEVFSEWAEWAYQQGLTDAQIDQETARFKEKKKATGYCCVDWEAEWKSWILNAIKFGLEVKPPAPKPLAEQPQLSLVEP